MDKVFFERKNKRRLQASRRCGGFLAAPLLLAHPGAIDHLPGVGGQDPRQAIDIDKSPFRELARVQTELGARCTGFLIAPTQIATAAHCLFIRRSGHFVRPGSVHVLLGYHQGSFAAHAVAVSYTIGPGFNPADENATGGADWAILQLPAPIGAGRTLPLDPTPISPGATLALAGYGMDREERADGDLGCKLVRALSDNEQRPLLLHSCAATLGTSGAPLLLRAADGTWRIVGLQIAAQHTGTGGVAIPIAAIDEAARQK